jgi:hypothetical protein
MCIAILNAKGVITDNELKNSWDNNPEGAGMLFSDNGKLYEFKSYNFDEFKKRYKTVRASIQGKIVLHFRIATSGHEKYVNLHPFFVSENLGFVHNGIISGLGDNLRSDTFHFNEMLKRLPNDFLKNEVQRELISSYIGSSKLLFLNSKGGHDIINEEAGKWENGNWFSNDSHKRNNDFVWFGNEKRSKTGKSAGWDYWAYKYETEEDGTTIHELTEELSFFYEGVTEASVKKVIAVIGCTNEQAFQYIEEWANYLICYDLSKLPALIQREISTGNAEEHYDA